ncbi:MAG: choline/carnitine O-acyltransferase [archaeon]|nr:choline/carnitine O-acyltransferase [archaeon]
MMSISQTMVSALRRGLSSSSRALAGRLEESVVPTYHFQPSLPRLKIPALESTCAKYLESVAPLISPEELAVTANLVSAFESGEGRRLDRQLRGRDSDRPFTSYISDPWFDMYLSNPDPVPINVNPFLMFKEDPAATGEGAQTARAAALVWSSLRFHELLSREKLAPEVFHTKPQWSQADWWPNAMAKIPAAVSWYAAFLTGAYPLDMSQFRRLFASSRIPGEHTDELTPAFDISDPHVVVIHRGAFHKLSTKGASPASIRAALDAIVSSSAAAAPVAENQRVGTLTTEERRTWASVRRAMERESAENAQSLAAIDSALFVLCLDDTEPVTMEEANRRFLCEQFHNRWFDKSFQLIVTPGGRAAVNFEHSWGDGVAVMRYFNEVYEDSKRHVSASRQQSAPAAVAPLKWQLSVAVKGSIAKATRRMTDSADSLEVKTDIFESFGRRYLKSCQVSPDAAVQMAFQLAYWRMHGATVATYESASTSGFRFGRTETIRTVSHDSVGFVRAMEDPACNNATRKALFQQACATHASRSMAAVMGNGFDRHLFALKYLAQELGQEVPALYRDAAYQNINHNILSTSTLVSDACEGGGFGPVVAHGYGVGYGVLDDVIGFNISNFKAQNSLPSASPIFHFFDNTPVAETDSAQFIQHARRALSDISAILDSRPF